VAFTELNLLLILFQIPPFLYVRRRCNNVLLLGCNLQEPNVSMIITDYWMPEMTGYELLKKVKVRTRMVQPHLCSSNFSSSSTS
jgi:CheY-like chemotaxis protein